MAYGKRNFFIMNNDDSLITEEKTLALFNYGTKGQTVIQKYDKNRWSICLYHRYAKKHNYNALKMATKTVLILNLSMIKPVI
jgi:hypothetical protein